MRYLKDVLQNMKKILRKSRADFMNDESLAKAFIEFVLRANEIEQKKKEIAVQEMAVIHAQGTQQALLEAQLSSTKQTLEVINLTRIITILTVALVIIGALQIILSLIQIAIIKNIV